MSKKNLPPQNANANRPITAAKRGQSANVPIYAVEVLEAAEVFFEIAMLANKLATAKLHSGRTHKYFLSPFITNMALCIELQLKAALIIDNEQPSRTHNIITLFDGLKPESQRSIELEYMAAHTANPLSQAAQLQQTNYDLRVVLKAMSESFVAARYPFGHNAWIPFYSADNVANALRSYLNSHQNLQGAFVNARP